MRVCYIWLFILYTATPWWRVSAKGNDVGNTNPDWDYNNIKSWKRLFPACGGSRQSPIDIRETMKGCAVPPSIVVDGDIRNARVSITNTGHAMKMKLWRAGTGRPLIRMHVYRNSLANAELAGTYVLDHLHFHWGHSADSFGSEHLIDGRRANGEVHFVFYRASYSSLKSSLHHADGIVVLGLLLRTQTGPSALEFPEKALGLLNGISLVSRPSVTVSTYRDVSPLLDPLLKTSLKDFYSYRGSLTTPPCREVVTWIVSRADVRVSRQLMSSLTSSLYANQRGDERIVDNWRPAQPVNNRRVVHFR